VTLRDATERRGVVPILDYHGIGDDYPPDELPFAFSPAVFRRHLDLIASQGLRTVTIDELVSSRRRGEAIEDAVAITFDDGYADLLHTVQPALAERGMVATAFITTGYVDARTRGDADARRWLHWDELRELVATGTFEIAAHSHDHIELDVIGPERAAEQAASCRQRLADDAGVDATSFAYPYGYSSGALRAALPSIGYRAACGVKHALSSADDDPFDLARVRILRSHTDAQIAAWIAGESLRVAPCRAQVRTQVFGLVRRARHLARGASKTVRGARSARRA
jgi:peptidoglycan/xylan/chitin deacetylase (PgdA/CDA1 family)